jgi:NTP pyrophosphatase (non-canonical NTP hydrolase)
MTHQELVTNLVKPGGQIAKEITPLQAHMLHMVLGIAGEAGELVDAVKKHVVYRKELDVANVIEEIGDLQFYIEGLCQAIGKSPGFCMAANVEKLTKRYGEKYSDKAAIERADKQEAPELERGTN